MDIAPQHAQRVSLVHVAPSERKHFSNSPPVNQPPRRSADSFAFQITAFRPPRRLQQTPLKSAGSLTLSPLWFDSCPRSGGLTTEDTEDTEDTEKEGFGDGADVHRSKLKAICPTPAKRFISSYTRPDPGAPRVGWGCIADFPVGCAVRRPEALRFALRPGRPGGPRYGRFGNLRYVAQPPVCPPGSSSRFTSDFGGVPYL